MCRGYTKGRDWYDFNWYVSRKTPINFILLNKAINQAGPWSGKHIKVTPPLFLAELKKKIESIDWNIAKQDVEHFLKPKDRANLEIWSTEFFLSRLEKLETYIIS